MNTKASFRFPTALRRVLPLSLAFGLALALGMGCDGEDTPCDNMCDEGAFGSVDEEANDGTLTCKCGKNTPSKSACEAYCVEMGGTAELASVDGKSCVCEGM